MQTDTPTPATEPTPGPTSAPGPSPAIEVATEAAKVIVAIIPGLGQYAVAIDLGFAIVEKVAPAAYTEIKALIASIQNGKEPSQDELARLGKMLAGLQTPENYFETKLADAEAEVEAEAQAAREAQLKAEAAYIPPDQQPGFCE